MDIFYQLGNFFKTMFHTETASGMLEHLKAHQEADHLVPQYAIDRLKEEE